MDRIRLSVTPVPIRNKDYTAAYVSGYNAMRAIVLSCDKYVKLAEHMIATYEQRWPSNDFTYRVPYNDDRPQFLEDRYGEKIELVRSSRPIPDTFLTLLEGMDDEEWVYYCPDDRYLVDIDESTVNDLYRWIQSSEDVPFDGVSFIRDRCLLTGEVSEISPAETMLSETVSIDSIGQRLHRRNDYSEIWLPQFLRVKVLRYLFENMPDPESAKQMDYLKYEVGLPEEHRLFVTHRNFAVVGEGTSRGKLTQNCIDSFREMGMELPEGFEHAEKRIVIGSMSRTRNRWIRLRYNVPVIKNVSSFRMLIRDSLQKVFGS